MNLKYSARALLVALLEEEQEEEEDEEDLLLLSKLSEVGKKHSRYQKNYINSLSPTGKKNRDRRIPRESLQSPEESVWKSVYESDSDSGLLTVTGLTKAAFNELLTHFAPIYWSNSPFGGVDGFCKSMPLDRRRTGRPRSLDAAGCLGLVLSWSRTRGSLWNLAVNFGLTSSTANDWLNFGKLCLIDVLRKHPSGAVKLPSGQETQEFIELISHKHPLLGDEKVWGTMDGLKLYIQSSGDDKVQSMFYNGWKCDHFVTNVLLFAPDGTIADGVYNCPGSVHDSQVAGWGKLYNRLGKHHEQFHGKITGDSAFLSGPGVPYIIKSAQNSVYAENEREVLTIREATSMRQASEWGMRALQGSFPRLKDRFLYEEKGVRAISLELIFRLFNFRTREVGLNQIQSVYACHLDQSANDFFNIEFHDENLEY